jgi:hypothetical protein
MGRNTWAGRATGRTRQRPPEKRVVTSYGHVGCGGAIVATTNAYGTTHGCAKCGKPTTPVGGNVTAPSPTDDIPL